MASHKRRKTLFGGGGAGKMENGTKFEREKTNTNGRAGVGVY